MGWKVITLWECELEKDFEETMMEVIEKMAKAMVGTYVRFGAFAKVVIDADKNKMGFRHEEKTE